jgi:hypothetical protein
MLQPRRNRCAALFLIGALVVAAGMAACGGSITPNVLTPTTFTITTLPGIDEMLADKTVGSASAPIQVIEYVSFIQAASATFHQNVFPQLKSQYADTGRTQIAFRNLLLSTDSVNAVLLARCTGNARFFDAVDTIFRSQASWAGSNDPDAAVGQVMLGFGMSPSVQSACVGNTALQAGVAKIHTDALSVTYLLPDGTQRAPSGTQGSILAVPAVVVNGVLLDGTNAADGSANPAFAPTLANIQTFLK